MLTFTYIGYNLPGWISERKQSRRQFSHWFRMIQNDTVYDLAVCCTVVLIMFSAALSTLGCLSGWKNGSHCPEPLLDRLDFQYVVPAIQNVLDTNPHTAGTLNIFLGLIMCPGFCCPPTLPPPPPSAITEVKHLLSVPHSSPQPSTTWSAKWRLCWDSRLLSASVHRSSVIQVLLYSFIFCWVIPGCLMVSRPFQGFFVWSGQWCRYSVSAGWEKMCALLHNNNTVRSRMKVEWGNNISYSKADLSKQKW